MYDGSCVKVTEESTSFGAKRTFIDNIQKPVNDDKLCQKRSKLCPQETGTKIFSSVNDNLNINNHLITLVTDDKQDQKGVNAATTNKQSDPYLNSSDSSAESRNSESIEVIEVKTDQN